MKHAIVTGYSSGIGQSICVALENNGYVIIKLSSRLECIKDIENEVKKFVQFVKKGLDAYRV